MSVIAFPTTIGVKSMTWSQQRNDTEFRSVFGAQAIEVTAPLWAVAMVLAERNDDAIGPSKALVMQLRGRTNQLSLFDVMRQAPRGTMRGTLTFNTAPAAGATSLSITGGVGQASTTLLQGDLIGFGSGLTQQVVMVAADATANGSGVIAVTVEPALRNAFIIGDGVTWDKPRALFRRTDSKAGWDYGPTRVSGIALNLLEDVRP